MQIYFEIDFVNDFLKNNYETIEKVKLSENKIISIVYRLIEPNGDLSEFGSTKSFLSYLENYNLDKIDYDLCHENNLVQLLFHEEFLYLIEIFNFHENLRLDFSLLKSLSQKLESIKNEIDRRFIPFYQSKILIYFRTLKSKVGISYLDLLFLLFYIHSLSKSNNFDDFELLKLKNLFHHDNYFFDFQKLKNLFSKLSPPDENSWGTFGDIDWE